MSEEVKRNSQTVQSVERAVDLLYCFTLQEYELSINDFVEKTKLNRTTVFRLLNSLRNKGLITRNEQTGFYRLGFPLIGMGQIVSENLDVREEAFPVLKKISKQTGETASLNIIQANRRICVEKVDGSEDIRQFVRLGYPYPLVKGASGKVLLAFCSEEFIENILKEWETENNETIDREEYYKELKNIRDRKVAISENERVLGACSISAPILDSNNNLIAGVSISSLSIKLTPSLKEEYKQLIRQAGEEISIAMGRRANDK